MLHVQVRMTLFDLDSTWNFANESRNIVSGDRFDRLLNLGLGTQRESLTTSVLAIIASN